MNKNNEAYERWVSLKSNVKNLLTEDILVEIDAIDDITECELYWEPAWWVEMMEYRRFLTNN